MIEQMKREIEDIKSINRRIIATLVRLEGKVDDMAERMATKDDLAALHGEMMRRFDAFAHLFDDKRLKKLEARRA